VANSSASTGVSWAGQPFANPILNSAMQVWQRGTSFTASGPAYAADRWDYSTFGGGSGQTISRVATGDTTNLPNIQYALRYQRNNGTTGTGAYQVTQSFETINSIPFANKTVTLSFYAKCGTTSNGFSSLVAQLRTGTGTDENVLSGLTGSATPINNTATLTTTWQRFSYSGTLASTATQIALYFSVNPTGTAGATDYFDITGVQIDLGSVALPFRTYAGTLQGELAACQRYYFRINPNATSNAANFGFGQSWTTQYCYHTTWFPVQMRTVPTAIDYPTLSTYINLFDGTNSITPTALTLESNLSTPSAGTIYSTNTGLTQWRSYILKGATNTGAYLGFSAEL
jgi:hypothetical protein